MLLRLAIPLLMAAHWPPSSSELLHNADDAFAAVGQLRGPLTCSGALIDPSGAGAAAAKGWFLTAGHCLSLEPYGVIRNQPLAARVQFRFFVDTPPDRRITVPTLAVGWSTMKTTDLAFVELDATLGELAAQGIRPFRLSLSTAEPGRSVFWTGISGSPIPPEQQFVRRGRCTLGRSVALIEGSWIWTGDLSNDCPDLYAGASGSPLFAADNGEVIGVISTSTLLNFEQGPDYDCQVNRPCVIGWRGPVMEENTSYAADVQGVARCFDSANALDLQRPGCPLDPGYQLTVQSGANEVRPEVDGKAAAWDAALSGNQRYYAYKQFRAGHGDCGNLAGYSSPIPVAGRPVISDLIGSEDGYYFLCVVAGDTPSFDSSWQKPSHASIRFKRLDSQPPLVTIDYELEPITNGYRLVFAESEGRSGLGVTLQKRGPLSTTDCSDARDYRVQISIPDVIRTSDWPLRICEKISDKAGNNADPAVFDFGPPALLPNAVRNGASMVRGTVAPGSAFRVDTFNLSDRAEYSAKPVPALAGVRISVLDRAGRTLPALMTTAGPLFVEAVMPESASLGAATLIVQPPQGPAVSQAFQIRRTAPGLFSENATSVPKGSAADNNGTIFPLLTCPVQAQCYSTPLPLSSSPGGLGFVLYGAGLRGGHGRRALHIGTYTLHGLEVKPHADVAGVDELRFHLPQDFPLRLYQAIAVETADGVSNYLWIYLE